MNGDGLETDQGIGAMLRRVVVRFRGGEPISVGMELGEEP